MGGRCVYDSGMGRKGKRTLHETPAEFAEAEKVRSTKRWQERMESLRKQHRRRQDMKMPAHREPKPRDPDAPPWHRPPYLHW